MWLLKLAANGEFSLVEYIGAKCPPYAILSHTWGPSEEEVTFLDLRNHRGRDKLGYRKLIFCSRRTAQRGLEHFWVDTCCIDKSSSAELSEAINSMFAWYRDAEVCFVYLDDAVRSESKPSICISKCRWFTRGWTLQELISAIDVEFFSDEGIFSHDDIYLGNKWQLEDLLTKITGVDSEALRGKRLSGYSTEERFKWAQNRRTTRPEDTVYCLLGMFDVHMPLIYGEGREKALRRLRKEILESSSEPKSSQAKPTTPTSKSKPDSSVQILPKAANKESESSKDRNSNLKNGLIMGLGALAVACYAWYKLGYESEEYGPKGAHISPCKKCIESKIYCDRGTPCQRCTSRGKQQDCYYPVMQEQLYEIT